MTPDTGDLAERFTHVFDAPPPPTAIDPQSLLEAGRRLKRQRRRTRRLATSTASLACLLAAGAFVFTSPHRTGPDTTTAGVGDPLTIQADFTWLPGPTRWIQYSAGTTPGTGSVEDDWTDGKVPVDETVTWDISPTPSLSGLKSVGTVNGQAAYSTGGALYFKSPAGRWALLTGSAFPSDASGADFVYVPVATELDIARGVRFTPREIALPIRIADAAAKPSLITFSTQGGDAWTLSLRYSEGSIDVSLDVAPGKPEPVTGGRGLDYYVGTHTFKDAAEASNGLGINIDMATPKGSEPGNPQAYLSRITSLGLNPNNWTTRPITD